MKRRIVNCFIAKVNLPMKLAKLLCLNAPIPEALPMPISKTSLSADFAISVVLAKLAVCLVVLSILNTCTRIYSILLFVKKAIKIAVVLFFVLNSKKKVKRCLKYVRVDLTKSI